MTDTTDNALDEMVRRLLDCAESKSSEAWGRMDGGLDLCIGAALADEAADAITTLRAERDAVAHMLDLLKKTTEAVLELATAAEAREQALLSTYDAERKVLTENVALKAEVKRLTGIITTLRNDMWQAMQDARTAALREAARVAADHTPEKHGGAPLGQRVVGATIQCAIRAMIEKDTTQ